MILSAGWIKHRAFGITPDETTFERRGFQIVDPVVQKKLERIGLAFVSGYNTSLKEDTVAGIALQLNEVELEFRGFAFEGAAMALTLLDCISPWRKNRLQALLEGPGSSHIYLVYVGAGWALARLRQNTERFIARADPLLGWLAIDGYGFHEGYFRWHQFIQERALPKRLKGYSRRVFDQGLGRSLWFVSCADTARIAATIAAFPLERQADLWSGIGLACAYAGGVDRTIIESLREASGPYRPHTAQGAAFAAKARKRAGNLAPHTELACEVLCGLSAETAANLTDAALERLPDSAEEPSYEIWRRLIQSHFARQAVIA